MLEKVRTLAQAEFTGSPARDSHIGQGTGTFYLGSDGVWYHTSVLRQFNGDGSLNAYSIQ